MALATTPTVPNHHAHHPGFSGARGLGFGLLFAVGRGRDARLATRLAGVRPGDRVVDIGCGPGTAVRAAARRGATATGVDPAPVMLRLARVLSWGRGRIDVVSGAAEALPLPAASATVVWSLATVHHWADVDRGLDEVARVLEPGGRFLAVERRSPEGATGLGSHGWTDEQAEVFAAACRAHGFVDVRVERVRPDVHERRRRHARLSSDGLAVFAGAPAPAASPAPA